MSPHDSEDRRVSEHDVVARQAMPPYLQLRADARRNRERILVAARDTFIRRGPDAPLEEIATRAGVGIATLYRRFPDRRALQRAVVLDALQRVTHEAETALAEEEDAGRALARYMHRTLDVRVSAVIPALLGRVSLEDAEIMQVRERSSTLMQQMIDQAQAAGALRPDVTFADIALLLVRMSHLVDEQQQRAGGQDLDDLVQHGLALGVDPMEIFEDQQERLLLA
jgi:AcrR family transcriptional regulator